MEQLARHTHTAPAAAQDAGGGIIAGGSGNAGSTWSLDYTGDSQAHTHSFEVETGNASNLPPYYTLAMIMRCA